MRFRAFSSEVDTGSREENASNKEAEPPFRFNRNGGSGMLGRCFGIVNPGAAVRRQGCAPRRVGDSSIQNHGTDCAFRGEEALSGAVASCAQLIMGIVMGGLFDDRGDKAGRVLALR
jgi:hypothetical protein